MIPPIILFLIILSLLVFVHELGHFIAARKNGVDVEEFGIGIPPRLWGKKIGKTMYSINWLPIGGFVKIKGEDSANYDPNDTSNFLNKKPWQKSVILLAGVFMNFILAVVLFYIVLGAQGWKSNPILLIDDYEFPVGGTKRLPNVVTFVEEGSPAEQAGIGFADQITSMSYFENTVNANSLDDIKNFLKDKDGIEIQVETININTDKFSSYTLIPRYREDIGQVAMGVGLGEAVRLTYLNPVQKSLAGFLHSINVLSYSMSMMKNLIIQSYIQRDFAPVSAGVAGPIGIFGAVKSILVYGGDKVVLTILDLSAILSISLGIMNFLPIPALDGGRWIFVLFELVSGKRPSVKFEEKAHQIGFAFLIGLLLLITAKDLFNL